MENKRTSTCSVIISTYNGALYLIQQLDSIRNQSTIPDEVIIRDDNSNDDTVKVLREYIDTYGLNWKLVVEGENKGYYRSFIDLAYLSSSDLVFFCDQDDIWETDKIEVILDFFETHSDALAVSCNIQCIDKENAPIRNHQYFNVSTVSSIGLGSILYTSNILGCTLGFKRSLLEMIDRTSLKADQGSHDTLISMLAACKNGLYKIPYVGVNYRIHGNNNSMKSDLSRKERIFKIYNYYNDLVEAIMPECDGERKSLGILKDVLVLQKQRLQFFDEKSISQIIGCLRKYCVYAGNIGRGIKLFCADIYYCYKK